MAKKDAKTKAVEKKLRAAAKQTKKADKKEKKDKRKGKDDGEESEDEDLDAILEEYAKQQAQFLKVTETACEPPPARTSATLLGSPANTNELFLFGGEFFNGAAATFYNDLHVYQIRQAQWRRVTSPNSPLPRSGHAWTRGANAGGVWLFGGEFSSPRQGTFYHYADFWRLEPATREWSRVDSKGGAPGPPARSGHRMTAFKNYVVLFGGFQDTARQTRYLADLWLYDTQRFAWFQPALPAGGARPDARSSCSLLPHDGGAVLFGGYSRVKMNMAAGKRTKGGGGQPSRTVLKPVVHQDTWFLRITPPSAESPAGTPPAVRWERRKRPANAPNPPRAGAAMAFHRARGICFGGVHDVEQSEEGIDSEFFDTLHAWNVERNRFFPLALRRPRGAGKKSLAAADRGGRRERGKADEEELLRNLAALETREPGATDPDAMEVARAAEEGVPEEEKEEAPRPEQPVQYTMPHPRFNAALGVQDDVLYIYGGTYELGDREYTFDEMFAIDLGKLDGVKQIFHRDVENWVMSDDEGSDEDEDADEGSEDEEMVDAPPPNETLVEEPEDAGSQAPAPDRSVAEDEEQMPDSKDSTPYPRPFETLKVFFARTSGEWQQLMLKENGTVELVSDASVKELRKNAFERAETKWWDCREEIMAMEDEQEEAGIGEVVSVAERGDAGPVRRR